MLELIKSARFQTEHQDYKIKIEKITSIDVKHQAELLLKTLVDEVRRFDNQHQEMFLGNIVPASISDSRNNIVNTRKKLDTLLKDYNQ
jgi:replication-associated recombination protein RarA